MGLFDSASTTNTAHGANDIPAPRPDSAVNAPPPDQHKRVIDFVRVGRHHNDLLSAVAQPRAIVIARVFCVFKNGSF